MRRQMISLRPSVFDGEDSIALAERSIFWNVHAAVGAETERAEISGANGRTTTVDQFQIELLEALLIEEMLDEMSVAVVLLR